MDSPNPDPSLALYVVGTGSTAERIRGAFTDATALRSATELFPLDQRRAGVVLLARDGVPAEEVLEVAEATSRETDWVVVVLSDVDGALEARPLSWGYRTSLDHLRTYVRTGGEEGQVLDLDTVMRRISRGRHDINNPLTSGLAETQLLLMDVHDPEIREALEVIQEQLRRIRDLVADLRTLRPPE